MAYVLAIDPGGAVLGWALFADGSLVAVGLSRPPKHLKTAWARADWHRTQGPLAEWLAFEDVRVVCERMVHRPWVRGADGKRRKVRVQDIIDLNLIAGHLGREWYSSTEWKGDLPREKEQERTLKRLSAEERELVGLVRPAGLAHNAVSAVGIGLYVVERGWKVCPKLRPQAPPKPSLPRKTRSSRSTARTSCA